MIRILDCIVADWGFFNWEYNGKMIQQVEVTLFNGMTLIMDEIEFISISSED